jgi:[methyl-Co(III) methanol-specific corrinoid protein]:coenzyme M methyltransferase
MTSRERVMMALSGRPPDRAPVCSPTSVATVDLMDAADAPLPEGHRDPRLMHRLALTARTELDFDAVMPVFSVVQESSALGCRIEWGRKDVFPS